MNKDMLRCAACEKMVPAYEGVYISSDSRFYCLKCYNETVSKAADMKFNHLAFHPINLEDKAGQTHTFNIRTLLFGDRVRIQALEIKGNEPKGYEFSIADDAECDLFDLFSRLVARIRRELARTHIESSDLIRYRILKDTVRGRITWDDDTNGELPCLVVDGKEISWHEFGRMLMGYEGWHFKMEIFEGTEER